MKQIQVMQERHSVSRRITEIKSHLRKYTSERLVEIYKLLNELVVLRQTQRESYDWRSLEGEHLGLSGSQIRYVHSFKFILPATRKQIEKGKMTESQACHLIHRFKFLREEQWQSRLLQAFFAGKIKMSFASELSRVQIKAILTGKKTVDVAERRLISFTKTVRSFSSVLNSMKVKKSPQTKHLISVLKDLANKLEDAK